MNWLLKRLTISQKINYGYGVMLLLVAAVGAASYVGINRLQGNLNFILGPAWSAADGAMEGSIGIQAQMLHVYDLFVQDRAVDPEVFKQRIADAKDFTEDALSDVHGSGLFPAEKLEQLDVLIASYEAEQERVTNAYFSTSPDGQRGVALRGQLQRFSNVSEELLDFIESLEEVGDAQVEGQISSVDETIGQVNGVLLASLVAALIIVLAVAIFSNRSIAEPIRAANARLREISDGDGDLTLKLNENGSDEIAQLGGNYNRFVEKLRSTITEVADVAGRIGEQGERMSEISRTSDGNLSQQKDEVEQLASAITELASTVQEVARSATSASSFAKESDSLASEGARVVNVVTDTINGLADEVQTAGEVIARLEAESSNIGTVLEVIRDIAEQTNLLALNATIESARAGEHGRGFAVVAEEVRTLASKTHESTEEIQEMIADLQKSAVDAVQVTNQSREKAVLAVSQVEKARETLSQISESASSINEMNLSIAGAAEEQGSCAAEISRNLEAMNQLSAENAEAAGEVSTTSEHLLTMATSLRETVRRFRTA